MFCIRFKRRLPGCDLAVQVFHLFLTGLDLGHSSCNLIIFGKLLRSRGQSIPLCKVNEPATNDPVLLIDPGLNLVKSEPQARNRYLGLQSF